MTGSVLAELPLAPFRHTAAGTHTKHTRMAGVALRATTLHNIRGVISSRMPLSLGLGAANPTPHAASIPAYAHVAAMQGTSLPPTAVLGGEAAVDAWAKEVYTHVQVVTIQESGATSTHALGDARGSPSHTIFLLHQATDVLPYRLIYTHFSLDSNHVAPTALTHEWVEARTATFEFTHPPRVQAASAIVPPPNPMHATVRTKQHTPEGKRRVMWQPAMYWSKDVDVSFPTSNPEATAAWQAYQNAAAWWEDAQAATYGPHSLTHPVSQDAWREMFADLHMSIRKAVGATEEDLVLPGTRLVDAWRKGPSAGAHTLMQVIMEGVGGDEAPTTWVSDLDDMETSSAVDVMVHAVHQGCIARGMPVPVPPPQLEAWVGAHVHTEVALKHGGEGSGGSIHPWAGPAAWEACPTVATLLKGKKNYAALPDAMRAAIILHELPAEHMPLGMFCSAVANSTGVPHAVVHAHALEHVGYIAGVQLHVHVAAPQWIGPANAGSRPPLHFMGITVVTSSESGSVPTHAGHGVVGLI